MQESIGRYWLAVSIGCWFSNGVQPPGGFLKICENDLDSHNWENTTVMEWVESRGASHPAGDENFPVSCVTLKYPTGHSFG